MIYRCVDWSEVVGTQCDLSKSALTDSKPLSYQTEQAANLSSGGFGLHDVRYAGSMKDPAKA